MKDGVKKFVGNKNLKSTQLGPYMGRFCSTVHPADVGGLRSYPAGFCECLCDAYERRGAPPADMRHKHTVDFQKKTDKDLWQELPMGDVWLDGQLPAVWFYLMGNRHLCIPDSWAGAIAEFDSQLFALVACQDWVSSGCRDVTAKFCIYITSICWCSGGRLWRGRIQIERSAFSVWEYCMVSS